MGVVEPREIVARRDVESDQRGASRKFAICGLLLGLRPGPFEPATRSPGELPRPKLWTACEHGLARALLRQRGVARPPQRPRNTVALPRAAPHTEPAATSPPVPTSNRFG